MDAQEIRSTLQQFIHTLSGQTCQDDDDLFATGLLDSQGVLQLVTFLEERFHLNIDVADVTLENLGSISAIQRLVLAGTSL
ncbi:MAG: acyl carrier protein [Magnetococcales bacterium]|nr:acyl carrier protein [Magnetococcales bacterium]